MASLAQGLFEIDAPWTTSDARRHYTGFPMPFQAEAGSVQTVTVGSGPVSSARARTSFTIGACCCQPDLLPHSGISRHAPEFFELVFAGDQRD